MTINDRFTRGFVAGGIAGIISGLGSYIAYYLDLTTLRTIDWAAILIFARTPPFSLGDQAYATLVHSGWTGIMGVLFAYIIRFIGSENYYFKGALTGLSSWFTVYILTTFFRVEGTLNIPLITALANFVGAVITGLAIAYFFMAFNPATSSEKSHSARLVPQPAAKPITQPNYSDALELTRDMEIDELRQQIVDLRDEVNQLKYKGVKSKWRFW